MFSQLSKYTRKVDRGFTLIELLIVIAILGVLAAAVLVAVDPIEQLARGRDSGRKSSVAQLGHALQAYYTTNQAYPVVAAWNTTLLNSGEIKLFPGNVAGALAATCTGGVAVNNYCYKVSAAATDIAVYTHLESKADQRKGTCAGVAVNTWYVYSSADGRGGILCQAAEPVAGTVYGVGLL